MSQDIGDHLCQEISEGSGFLERKTRAAGGTLDESQTAVLVGHECGGGRRMRTNSTGDVEQGWSSRLGGVVPISTAERRRVLWCWALRCAVGMSDRQIRIPAWT